MPEKPDCNVSELLAVLIAREVKDWEMCACGALSQIPAAGLLLAEATHAPHVQFIIRSSREFDQVGYDMHFLAQRGQMDLFFVSGIQIDAEGNFNLHVIGNADAPDVRMPGAYGTAMLYYTAKRIIIFRTEHTRRTFVEKVDFISGSLKTPEKVKRHTQSVKVITPMAIMDYDWAAGRFRLGSVHPWHTVQEVQDNTAFDLGAPPQAPATPAPTVEELRTLRTVVRERMIDTGTYPVFAREGLQPA
ncbi:MAG: CoA synthetase [Chloroflexi bacterium]|nr:CoA synthetase [Chloroflexota bacterium]